MNVANQQCVVSCTECGTSDEHDEIRHESPIWTAFGRNCFDFNWRKSEQEIALCMSCMDRDWNMCADCGAIVDRELYGTGYLPDDYDGDYMCPECAKKSGHEITVNLYS